MKPELNFVKLVLSSTLAFLIATSARATEDSVTVTDVAPPGYEKLGETQEDVIALLKNRAIVQWLQSHLGTRYPRFEKSISRDFDPKNDTYEKFILDYETPKLSEDQRLLKITVHVDGNALRRWIRSVEAKARGGPIRILWIVSSELLNLSARDTAFRVKDNLFAKTLFSLINFYLQKSNLRAEISDLGALTLSSPPGRESDVRMLRDQLSRTNCNGVIWTQVSVCRTCGGARIDFFYYNLLQTRIALARSDDLALDAKDLSQSERLVGLLKPAVQGFKAEFEDLLSSGTLLSSVYYLLVDEIATLPQLKEFESALATLDFLSPPLLKAAVPKENKYQYEVMSPTTIEDLAQRLNATEAAKYKIKIYNKN